jgi:hypothetical protein
MRWSSASVVVTGLVAWAAASATGATDSPATSTRPSTQVSATGDAHVVGAAATVLSAGTIEDHRFVKSFSLAHGALVLRPFVGRTPTISTAEETTMWATQGIGGAIEVIGFADVTLKRSMTTQLSGPAVTPFSDTPALVGLTKDNPYYACPMGGVAVLHGVVGEGATAVYSTYIPISQGWSAVIFPLNLRKSDAVFTAASNVCRRLVASTVETAYESLSVDWHLENQRGTGPVIVASVPKCGRDTMAGGGGNEHQDLFEYQVEATVLDRPVNATCSAATTFDEGPNYASPSTTHGFTGPILSVGPYAGYVMTSRGPRQQSLY